MGKPTSVQAPSSKAVVFMALFSRLSCGKPYADFRPWNNQPGLAANVPHFPDDGACSENVSIGAACGKHRPQKKRQLK
jgi:hypothetical protein